MVGVKSLGVAVGEIVVVVLMVVAVVVVVVVVVVFVVGVVVVVVDAVVVVVMADGCSSFPITQGAYIPLLRSSCLFFPSATYFAQYCLLGVVQDVSPCRGRFYLAQGTCQSHSFGRKAIEIQNHLGRLRHNR